MWNRVNTTISNFTTKHSTDLDGISTHLFKTVSLAICTPLSHIFNLSINYGIFPSKLKRSRTVPIFNSGNPETCDNYRPISLLSSLSKILEKLVSIQLVNHLELNNLLYEHQYGFQKINLLSCKIYSCEPPFTPPNPANFFFQSK